MISLPWALPGPSTPLQETRRGGVPQGKKQGWVTVLRGEKEQVPKAPLRGAQVSLTTQGNAEVQEHLFLHLTQEHGDGSSFFPNEHNFLFSLMLSYSLGSIKMPLSDPALDTLKSLGKVKADKNSSLCCSFLPVRPTSNPDPPGPFQAGSRNTAGSESPSTACVFLHSQPGAATSSHLFAEKRQKPEDGTSSISWRACTCTKS